MLQRVHPGQLVWKSSERSNTLKKDNPTLNCRISGLEEFSPIRIILSEKMDLDLSHKVFSDQNKNKTYIATNNKNEAKQTKFLKLGIKIIVFDNLKNLLNQLCTIGINNLLIEGGAKTVTEFLKAELIDEIFHFQGNQILGNDAIHAIHDLNLNKLEESLKFKKILQKDLNGDRLIILQKNQ